jgi:HEAT repeat protein
MSYLFPSSTITLEAALRDVASSNVKARLRAVQALGHLEDATARRRAAAALVVALDDNAAAVRAEAAAALGQLAEVAPVPALVARLADGDSAVRQQAAIALGGLRDRSGFAPLLEALRDGPADLRFQAVTSLAEIDPVAAYEPLTDALGDRDAKVAAAAAVALGTLGDGRAVRHLVPALGHSDAEVRFEAAWALAELGDARGSAELRAQLPGRAPSAAPAQRMVEAVEALARLGSSVERDALAGVLAVKDAPPEVAIVAARYVLALAAQRPHEAGGDAAAGAVAEPATAVTAQRRAAEQVLLAALGARKEHLRGLAIEQLAHVGGDWATAPLRALRAGRRGRALLEPIDDALAAIAARELARGDVAATAAPLPATAPRLAAVGARGADDVDR